MNNINTPVIAAPTSAKLVTSDAVIYAIKGSEVCDVYPSLLNGEGRYGWSYIEKANLHELKDRIAANGWHSLTPEEQDCYQPFLLELKPGDYVVYINVPEWGKCTLARVTGSYKFRWEDVEFNHRFPVDPASICTFDRNDQIVHPALRARLKLQGRFWRIYLKEEFEQLVLSCQCGAQGSPRTASTGLAFLSRGIQPQLAKITEMIHHTHPNYDLENLMAEIFRKIPGIKAVKCQGGAGDHGADLIVVYETGLPIPGLQREATCVIQVKSFTGQHWDIKAVSDIRRAFDAYPEAEMGMIVSTANESTEALEEALDNLREETGKPVALLIGADVAAFLLRFGGQLLA